MRFIVFFIAVFAAFCAAPGISFSMASAFVNALGSISIILAASHAVYGQVYGQQAHVIHAFFHFVQLPVEL